jgi:hypothetical protein
MSVDSICQMAGRRERLSATGWNARANKRILCTALSLSIVDLDDST